MIFKKVSLAVLLIGASSSLSAAETLTAAQCTQLHALNAARSSLTNFMALPLQRGLTVVGAEVERIAMLDTKDPNRVTLAPVLDRLSKAMSSPKPNMTELEHTISQGEATLNTICPQ